MIPFAPFYLIRHGESVANAAQIAAGGLSDSDLSPLGHRQPQILAPYLKTLAIKPSRIFHSSMLRARKTAEFLNQALNLEMTEVHDLREQEIGDWEGQPWEDIHPRWVRRDDPENGETNAQFAARIQRALTFCLEQSPDHPPMIVAHGGLFFAIGLMYDMYEAITDVKNCELHHFEPHTQAPFFPWKVTRYVSSRDYLEAEAAPFCTTRLAPKGQRA